MSGNGEGQGRARGMRERLPWVVAAIAVVALVANVLWTRSDRASADEAALQRLEQRLEALEGPAGGTPVPAPRMPMGGPMGTPMPAPGAGSEASALGDAQTPEQAAAQRERELRELEARFEADTPDPVGGARVERTLVETISGEAMASTGLRPQNVDIACKQASCRVVGSFDRMGDAQDWGLFYITAAGSDVIAQARMVLVPRPDGTFEVRIYSDRAG